MRVWREHGSGGSRDTWEGYILSQEGPTQCCQEAGFFLCRQCLSATGLQLLVWTQSTFRDWKPLPQAAEQGLHGPTCQHTSQAPDEQFPPRADLKGKEEKAESGKCGCRFLLGPSLSPDYTVNLLQVWRSGPGHPETGVRWSWLTVMPGGGADVAVGRALLPSSGTESRHAPRKMHLSEKNGYRTLPMCSHTFIVYRNT